MRLKPHDREAASWARALMERQVAQMVRLIDDLLDLSRVSRGRIELRHERSDLATLVQGALDVCGPSIANAGHRLTVELPGTPMPLVCDPTRVVQVICNLLSNAVKYTPPGGHITLSARRRDDLFEVSVRDTGIGIPGDMLARVFDMFTQVPHAIERSQGGLGIGLTLVKRLVELHGGQVEAKSVGPGLGAEFIVRLPERMTAHAAPMMVAALADKVSSPKQRILVADDNRDAADSLAVMLRIAGHDVRTAYDGQQALDVAETFKPSLALLDLGMPRVNGHDTARRLRETEHGRNIVIIALTGWGQPEDRNRSLAAGFDHHLVKPVDPSMLERLLAAPARGKKTGSACRGEDGPRGGVDQCDRPLELVGGVALQRPSDPDLR
jgi:CheY-like chemotaxis protein